MVLIELSPKTIYLLLELWKDWEGELPIDDKEIDRTIHTILKLLKANKQELDKFKTKLSTSNF